MRWGRPPFRDLDDDIDSLSPLSTQEVEQRGLAYLDDDHGAAHTQQGATGVHLCSFVALDSFCGIPGGRSEVFRGISPIWSERPFICLSHGIFD
jgi:hypothetical protein